MPEAQNVSTSVAQTALEPPDATWMWKSQSTYAVETGEADETDVTETSSSSNASLRHKTFSSLVGFRLFGTARWHRRLMRVEGADIVYSRTVQSHSKHIPMHLVQGVRLVDKDVMQRCKAPEAFTQYGWALQVNDVVLYFCADTNTAREMWVRFLGTSLARRRSNGADLKRQLARLSPHRNFVLTPSASSRTTVTDFCATQASSEVRSSVPRAISSNRGNVANIATADTALSCPDGATMKPLSVPPLRVHAATVQSSPAVVPAARGGGAVTGQALACQRPEKVSKGSALSSFASRTQEEMGSIRQRHNTPSLTTSSSASGAEEVVDDGGGATDPSAPERESSDGEFDAPHLLTVSSEDSEADPDAEACALALSFTAATPSFTAASSAPPPRADRGGTMCGQWAAHGPATTPRDKLLVLASHPYLTLSTSRLRAVRNGLRFKDEADDLRLACAVDKIGKRDNVQPRELVVTSRSVYLFTRSRMAGFRRRRRLPTTCLVGVLQSSTDSAVVALLVPTFHDIILSFARDATERQPACGDGGEADDDKAERAEVGMPSNYTAPATEYLVAHLYRIYTELHLDRPFVLRAVAEVTGWVRRRAQDAPRALEARKEDYMQAATHPTLLPLLRREANMVVYWSSMVRYVSADFRPVLRALVVTDGALYVLLDTMARVRRRVGLGTVRELQYDCDTQGILLRLTVTGHDILFSVQSSKEFAELISALRSAVREVQGSDLLCTPSRQLYSRARLGPTPHRATRQCGAGEAPSVMESNSGGAVEAARGELAERSSYRGTRALKSGPHHTEVASRLPWQAGAEGGAVSDAGTSDAKRGGAMAMHVNRASAHKRRDKTDETASTEPKTTASHVAEAMRPYYIQYRCVEEGLTEYDMVKALQASPTPAQLARMDHAKVRGHLRGGDGESDDAGGTAEGVYGSAIARVLPARALPTLAVVRSGLRCNHEADWGQVGMPCTLAVVSDGLALCSPSPTVELTGSVQSAMRCEKFCATTLIPWQDVFALVCAEERAVAALGLLSCSAQDQLLLLCPFSRHVLRDVVHACVLAYSRSTHRAAAQPVLRVYVAPCGVAHVAHILRRGEREPPPTLALRTATSSRSCLPSCCANSDRLHLALEPNVAEACRRYGDTTLYFTGLAWRFRTATVRRHTERAPSDPMQEMNRENNQLYKSFVLIITDGAVYHCSKGGYEIVRRTALRAIAKVYVLAADIDTMLLVVPDEYDMYFRVEGRGAECLRRLREACALWYDGAEMRAANSTARGRPARNADRIAVQVMSQVAALSRRLTRPEGYKSARASAACREEMQQWHVHALRDALLSMQAALRLAKNTATTTTTVHTVRPTPLSSAVSAAELRARWDEVWSRLVHCAARLRARQRFAFRCGLRWEDVTDMRHAERFLARQVAMQRIVAAAQDALRGGDAASYAAVVAAATPEMELFVRAHHAAYAALRARQASVARVVQFVPQVMRSHAEGTLTVGEQIAGVCGAQDRSVAWAVGESQMAEWLVSNYAYFVMQRIHVCGVGRQRVDAPRCCGTPGGIVPDARVLQGPVRATLGLAPCALPAAPEPRCLACWTTAAVRRVIRLGAFDVLPRMTALLAAKLCSCHGDYGGDAASSLPPKKVAVGCTDTACDAQREILRAAQAIVAQYQGYSEGRRAVREQVLLVLTHDAPRGARSVPAALLRTTTALHESAFKSLPTGRTGTAEQPDAFAAERCAWAAMRNARRVAAAMMRGRGVDPRCDPQGTMAGRHRATVGAVVSEALGARRPAEAAPHAAASAMANSAPQARGAASPTHMRSQAMCRSTSITCPRAAASTAAVTAIHIAHNTVTADGTSRAHTAEVPHVPGDTAFVEQQDMDQLLFYLVSHASTLSVRAVATLRVRWFAAARRRRCGARLPRALTTYVAGAADRSCRGAGAPEEPIAVCTCETDVCVPHALSPRDASHEMSNPTPPQLPATRPCPSESRALRCTRARRAGWLMARLSELDVSHVPAQKVRVLFAAMTAMLHSEVSVTCANDFEEEAEEEVTAGRLVISRGNPHTRNVVQAWLRLLAEPLSQSNMPLLDLLHALAALRGADHKACATHCQKLCAELDRAMTTTTDATADTSTVSARRELYAMVFLLQCNGLRLMLQELRAAQPRLVRDAGCLAEAALMDQPVITVLITLATLQEEHMIWPFSPEASDAPLTLSSSSAAHEKDSEGTLHARSAAEVAMQGSFGVRVMAAQNGAAALRRATRAVAVYFTSHVARHSAGAAGLCEGEEVAVQSGDLFDQRVHAEVGVLVEDAVLPALLTLLEAGFVRRPQQRRLPSQPEETLWDLLCCYEELVRRHMHAMWEAQFVAAVSRVTTLTGGVPSTSGDTVDAAHTLRVRLLLLDCLTQGILVALLEGLFLVTPSDVGDDGVAVQWDNAEGGLWHFYDRQTCVLWPSDAPDTRQILCTLRRLLRLPFRLRLDAFAPGTAA